MALKPPKIWTVFTDEKGLTYSWARVTCSIMVGFAMGWGTFIVAQKKVIPDFTSFALLIGAVYGVNRIGEAFGDKAKTQQDTATVTATHVRSE